MKRQLKDFLKRTIYRGYRLGERMGWHVVPVNYYSPLVDIRELTKTKDRWAKPSPMLGIRVDLDEQLRALREVVGPFVGEVLGGKVYTAARDMGYGPGYGYVEAQALHGVIRHFKPPRIIEVGSGVSTACAVRASEMNAAGGAGSGDRLLPQAAPTSRGASAITCIEPYPSARLKADGRVTLIEQSVQAVPVETFAALDAGDLLFIDSSHICKTGSDVNYLYLEVLPVLKPGVLVHVHDVYFPFDHQPVTLTQFYTHNETAVLRAYMTHNPHIEIVFCLSHLFHQRQAELKSVFSELDPQPIGPDGLDPPEVPPFAMKRQHFPTSIYLRTK